MLVAAIERELAANGARVTESAELEEYEGSTTREIDVLIEAEVNRIPIRIALECREHARKQDKTWIDQLIGKYRDIPVSQVVAVSKSGFTAGAMEKARAVGIMAVPFAVALDRQWPKELVRPWVRFLAVSFRLARAHVLTDGPLYGGLADDAPVHDKNGAHLAPLKGWLESLFGRDHGAGIREHLEPLAPAFLVDGVDREFSIPLHFAGTGCFVEDRAGNRREICRIFFAAEVRVRILNASTEHYLYREVPITVGTLPLAGNRRLQMVVIQEPDETPGFKIAFQAVEEREKQPD